MEIEIGIRKCRLVGRFRNNSSGHLGESKFLNTCLSAPANAGSVPPMPTLEHNGLVDMFRENPSLAPHLVELLFHLEVPRYASVAVVESSLDQLIPVEFRADLVLELRDESGQTVLSILLEVQRDEDPEKQYWRPVYLAVERSRKRCPALVLVVAPDTEVATGAADSIDLGLGLSNVKPLVLGPAVVPEVTEQPVADREPELAVLSAMAHGNGPNGLAVVEAAFTVLGRMAQEYAATYFQIIYEALREPMRRALEKSIMERQTDGKTKATFPPFAQQLIDRGLREGWLMGWLEGRRKGVREGEHKGERKALLRLMARAGIALTEEERARVDGCEDVATLDRWLDNILGAKTAADVLG